MKKSNILLVMILLQVTAAQGTVGGGFGKIWDGIKDVASGTWDVIASPFRSEEPVKEKDTKRKEVKKEVVKKK